jgi:hypothetical protein
LLQGGCCGFGRGWVADFAPFEITSTQLIDDHLGRRLVVVGFVENNTGQQLNGVTLAAHIQGSPADTSPITPVGCSHTLLPGDRGQAMFTIPVPKLVTDPEVVVRTQAIVTPEIQVVSFSGEDVSLDGHVARGTLVNGSDEWLRLVGVCMSVYDQAGQLTGFASVPASNYIEPGGVFDVAGLVPSVASPARAEIVAYAEIGEAPPQPVPTFAE